MDEGKKQLYRQIDFYLTQTAGIKHRSIMQGIMQKREIKQNRARRAVVRYESYQARKEIQRLLWEGKQEEAGRKAKALAEQPGENKTPLQQRFFRQTALYQKRIKGVPTSELEQEVLEALRLTLPDFPGNEEKVCYQSMELSLLALYGEVLWEKGQEEESLRLFWHLVHYAETRLSDPYERVKVYLGLTLLFAQKKVEKGESIKGLYQATLRLLQEEHSLVGLREWLILKKEAAIPLEP